MEKRLDEFIETRMQDPQRDDQSIIDEFRSRFASGTGSLARADLDSNEMSFVDS